MTDQFQLLTMPRKPFRVYKREQAAISRHTLYPVTAMYTLYSVTMLVVGFRSGRPLTAFASAEGRPQWPAWSPDGKRVAVQAGHYDREHPEKNESDIWVVEMASGRATKVGMRTGTRWTRRPRGAPTADGSCSRAHERGGSSCGQLRWTGARRGG